VVSLLRQVGSRRTVPQGGQALSGAVHPAVAFSGPGDASSSSSTMSIKISPRCSGSDCYTSARAADLRDSGDIGSYGQNLRRMVSRF
jgi:hypothetical protein